MLHRWQSSSHSQILQVLRHCLTIAGVAALPASTTAGVAALPEMALETGTEAMADATMLRTQITITEHSNGYNDINVYHYLQSRMAIVL